MEQKFKNKIENVAKKRPVLIPVLGKAQEKDMVQWALVIQKKGLPVGQEMIIQKDS